MEMIDRYNEKYEILIERIFKAVEQNHFVSACKMIRFCANFKYKLNDMYYDQRLEKALEKISINYPVENSMDLNKTILFYDQVADDNRCLSMHYLLGMLKSRYKIVYVHYEDESRNKRLRHICHEAGVTRYTLGNKYDLSCLNTLVDIYNKERPMLIFSQNHVDDFVGVLFNYVLSTTASKRYLINITDHAFWIGQSAYDKIIEFRDYGYTITKSKRNIDISKLVKLPYYAFPSRSEFHGFDFPFEGKKILFSGGAIYKTKGSDVFYKIITKLLQNHDDLIFLYLGDNAIDYVYSQIPQNLKSRVFVYDERDDLDAVIQHSYMYLNTFPLCGALMTLYASRNGRPPFTVREDINEYNPMREFFKNDIWKEFVCESADELIEKMEYFLSNENTYHALCDNVKKACIDEEEFNRNLCRIIDDKHSDYKFAEVPINFEAFYNLYRSNFEEQLSALVGTQGIVLHNFDILNVFTQEAMQGLIPGIIRRSKRLLRKICM